MRNRHEFYLRWFFSRKQFGFWKIEIAAGKVEIEILPDERPMLETLDYYPYWQVHLTDLFCALFQVRKYSCARFCTPAWRVRRLSYIRRDLFKSAYILDQIKTESKSRIYSL